MRPAAPIVALLLLVAAPATAAAPEPIVIEGAGTAHGMGLAMDGVLGQARAGWTHSRILDLFYPGTVRGTHAGTVRVGLARSPGEDDAPGKPARLAFVLPSGGRVSANGLLLDVRPGARIVVAYAAGRYTVEVPEVRAAQTDEIVPLPSDPPPEGPAPPAPSPTPVVPAPGPPSTPADPSTTGPVTIVPAGDTALTLVEATGRRYRGTMVVRYGERSRALWAVNHVDLETYVQGIAEEKGQGWPHEGLKVLAVAARSLAASTMTWRTNRHADHNDICATEFCQVYLGYDGEEPAMIEATLATRSEIRTYDGRAILAMYHGNGGGQTDTYRLIYGDGVSDPFPYLRSVRYPHANPKTWTFAFDPVEVGERVAAGGYGSPGPVRSIEVVERGDSPRVRRVRVTGDEGSVELSGLAFQSALELPSAWFDVGDRDPAAASASEVRTVSGGLGLAIAPATPPDGPPARSWTVAALAAALAALGGAVVTRPPAAGWHRRRDGRTG